MGEVTTIGSLPLGGWKWHGGVMGPDARIYAMPANADRVLRVDPRTQEVTLIGPVLPSGQHREDGKYKFLGGVAGCDVCVYGMPGDCDGVLKIQTETEEVSIVGGPFLGANKWQNGYLASDKCIYGIPLRADEVLRINCLTGEVSTVGGPLPGKDKWEGGVVGQGGALYCMPLRAKASHSS